jgi:transmembrane sensor
MASMREMTGENPNMNPSANSSNSAEIEGIAAAWFAKRESGEWSAADQAQLDTWLDSSTAHRIAFIRIMTAWERSGRLNALGAGVPRGIIPPRDAWGFAPSKSPASTAPPDRVESLAGADPAAAPSMANIPEARTASSRFARALRFPPRMLQFSPRLRAIFASLLVGTAAGTIWYFSTGHANSYRTPIGAVATVPLSDGSKVTLNTDTRIRVELDTTMRRVKLDQGEAFFDVSKDAARPFVVEIADKRVIAVGTQFSVRRDDNDIRVLVTEGRVWIERRGMATKAAQTQLAAGSEARTLQTAVLIDQPAPAQVEQLLSWRSGHIVFRDTTLADAVADFNRYSARKIFIEDPAIAGIRIGGNFRSGDTDAFLWLLQSGFPINVEQRSDRIILTKR